MYFLSINDLSSYEDVWLAGSTIILPNLISPVDSGTAILKYKVTLDTYADNTATVFPDNFINLFIHGILNKYYTWDVDDRELNELQLYKQELGELRKEANRATPRPPRNRHGYIKERL